MPHRPIHRRIFLKLTAGAFGAASAFSIIPATICKALSILANNATGTIMDVEHVVIFVQENRSFDHYFGALNGVRRARHQRDCLHFSARAWPMLKTRP